MPCLQTSVLFLRLQLSDVQIGVRDVISHSDHGGSSQDANDIALVFLDKCGTVPGPPSDHCCRPYLLA